MKAFSFIAGLLFITFVFILLFNDYEEIDCYYGDGVSVRLNSRLEIFGFKQFFHSPSAEYYRFQGNSKWAIREDESHIVFENISHNEYKLSLVHESDANNVIEIGIISEKCKSHMSDYMVENGID